MTSEERDLIAKFIARVGGAPQSSGGFLTGGAPAQQPQLPPIDREADAFIAEQFQRYPEAKYRMTQTAMVQEAALAEAQNRIQQLQWELEQARQEAQQAAHQSQQQDRGFLGGLFGGGQRQQPAPMPARQGGPMGAPAGGPWGGQQGGYAQQPPAPQYAPNYQPGMFQRGGSGFLGTALTTAAGVAGGMVVGNALMNAFSGHGAGAAGLANAASNPWDAAGTAIQDPTAGFENQAGFSDPFAGGGMEKDPGLDTQTGSSWDDAGSSYDSGGGDSGGGFDDNF
jgi:uncharacterized protein